MEKRQFGEMIAYFNRKVSEMDIAQKYKMELLGMITAIEIQHDMDMPKWIPFTTRELTEEEREENPEWDWVFDCPLPADGETVLLTNGKYVWEDMFCCDDGCYFDKADDIEDFDGYAWMKMPEPYRGENERC